MSSYNGPGLEALSKGLLDRQSPVAKRMRAIYYLRSMETLDAVNILLEALNDKENSPLLRHELAYVLGQIKNPEACEALEGVLADTTDDAMVRHESAEALGNIGQALESAAFFSRISFFVCTFLCS